MEVTIKVTSHERLRFVADTLDVARLVASSHGFDLEIEPMEPGKTRLTATHRRTGAVLRSNGVSVVDAAERIIGLLTK